MKFSFDKSIGLEGLPKSSFKLLKLFFIFSVSMRALFMLSNTFYVLYVINIVSYFQLGVLYSVTFLSQALLDYPSGVLGDKYGYKWVLGVAYVLHSISYGLLVIANDFQSILIIYLIEGIANSQESGALNAWFENSYKKDVGTIVTDRKLF